MPLLIWISPSMLCKLITLCLHFLQWRYGEEDCKNLSLATESRSATPIAHALRMPARSEKSLHLEEPGRFGFQKSLSSFFRGLALPLSSSFLLVAVCLLYTDWATCHSTGGMPCGMPPQMHSHTWR